MTLSRPMVIFSILVQHPLLGLQRNKRELHGIQHKPNIANIASEILWVCFLLTELGVTLPHTPVVYCDNVGVTYLCVNLVFHSRMKHLALDYHFIRDNVNSGALRVSHVSTHDQLADTLIKPFSRSWFQELSSKIGVRHLPTS